MMQFDEAFRAIMKSARKTGSEQVSVETALHRILALDVISDVDIPPFHTSKMDGYACRKSDINNDLYVIETIQAGHVPKHSIHKNECSKIMTGAMIPVGSDCVIKLEDTSAFQDTIIRYTKKKTSKSNISLKGDFFKKGDTVIRCGEKIEPQHIALMISVGYVKPDVACRPKIGIIATGSELINPEDTISGAKIRNSNSYQLFAQAQKMGMQPTNYGIVADTKDSIAEKIQAVRTENDVILLTGGVSNGDYDLVPDVMRETGFTLLIERTGIKPGKPMVFGVADDVVCFALPGNPVSNFVMFEIFVKPFIFEMMGYSYKKHKIPLILGEPINRKRTERMSIIPVYFASDGNVIPIEYHGSANTSIMYRADGLVFVPPGVKSLEKGSIVHVQTI